MVAQNQPHQPPHGYAVANLKPAIITCPMAKLANILIAKLTGLMITLINSTGIRIKAIRGCTFLGVILIRKVVIMWTKNFTNSLELIQPARAPT